MDIQDKKRRNHTTRFLFGSFVVLLFISAAAFLCLGAYMSHVSEDAIDRVGDADGFEDGAGRDRGGGCLE